MSSTEAFTKSDIEALIAAEKKAVGALNDLRTRILNAHHDYSIAKTVGAGTSIGGTVATVAGFFLAPFTAGTSLLLTAGGITSIVLGTGTSLTTGIIEMVKTKEWTDVLIDALADRELELQKIGDKIVSHPDWLEIIKMAGKGTAFVITKAPSFVTLGRIIKYLSITAPKYGLDKLPAYMFAASGLPAQFLLKTNNLLTNSLAKMGVRAVRIGVQGLMVLRVGLGLAGIGLDIYSIVDTWTSTPDSVQEIDEILKELEESIQKLEEFKDEL